jgi:hypothetical protein
MADTHEPQLVGAYVLGVLDPRERDDMEAHLAGCEACRAELAELEGVKGVLDELPPEALLHGPPDADLVLQKTLRQVRAESSAQQRRGRSLAVAAAVVIVAGAVAGGVAIGRGTSPTNIEAQPGPTVVISAAPSPLPSGTRTVTATDPRTNVRMTTTVVPAAGWVRIKATVLGIPKGEDCRLVVVGRNHPQGEIAAGWLVSAAGEKTGTTLDGAASVAPGDVIAIKVVNTAGETFVTVTL